MEDTRQSPQLPPEHLTLHDLSGAALKNSPAAIKLLIEKAFDTKYDHVDSQGKSAKFYFATFLLTQAKEKKLIQEASEEKIKATEQLLSLLRKIPSGTPNFISMHASTMYTALQNACITHINLLVEHPLLKKDFKEIVTSLDIPEVNKKIQVMTKPSILKKFLHSISFGMLYDATYQRAQAAKSCLPAAETFPQKKTSSLLKIFGWLLRNKKTPEEIPQAGQQISVIETTATLPITSDNVVINENMSQSESTASTGGTPLSSPTKTSNAGV